MKLIYVVGPYRSTTERGLVDNIRRAEARAIEVWQLGAAALVPHMNTAHFGGIIPDRVFLDGTLEMMRRCDALITCEGWELSIGSVSEIEKARRLGLPVFHKMLDLRIWLHV